MASKIVVAGDINGQFTEFFAKLAQVHAKQNFAFAVVAGNLCHDATDQSDAKVAELAKLMTGDIEVPVTTYFAIGRRALPAQVIDHLNSHDGELCPNLIALGRKGRMKTSEGFKIVAIGGAHFEGGNEEPTDSYAAAYTDKDANAAKGYNDADILVTSEWPSTVRYGSAAGREIKPSSSTEVIADLCSALKPRYHFSTGDAFFQREPFFHAADPPRPITRFVSIAPFGNEDKQKWLYAISIEPSAAPPDVPPEGTTASPFTKNTKRKLEPQEDAYNNSRFSNGHVDRPFYERGGKRRRNDQRRPDESSCYFCLSGKRTETHMIGAIGSNVYLTTSKGPLPLNNTFPELGFPGHILIILVDHNPTLATVAPATRLSATEEMYKYRDALHKMFADKGRDESGRAKLGAVTWEISKASGVHLQWQIMPFYAAKIDQGLIEAAFKAEAENSHFPTEFTSSDADSHIPDEQDYFKVMLWSEGSNGSKARSLTLPLNGSFRFDLQFGRRVMAKLLGLENRTHWKDCPQSQDEETADADVLKKVFEPYDPAVEFEL